MTFKYKFGEIDKETDFQKLVVENAVLLDVRTQEEFDAIHLNNSIHIPLDLLENILTQQEVFGVNGIPIRKGDKILVYCQSGIRSQFAKDILLAHGFQDVHNAGSWMNFEEDYIPD